MVSRVRCSYERDFFPAEDFDETTDFGLVHERNIGGAPRHTVTGRMLPDTDFESSGGWVGPSAGDTEEPYV